MYDGACVEWNDHLSTDVVIIFVLFSILLDCFGKQKYKTHTYYCQQRLNDCQKKKTNQQRNKNLEKNKIHNDKSKLCIL